MTVLALPLFDDAGVIAIIAFLGGFSAATAMVIVDSVAVAVMISNHLVMPIVLRRRAFSGVDLGGFVLGVRRVSIVVVILLAYAYYRASGEAALASIGLLSFAAIAQIAPAFLGGLIWSRGTALGASVGLVDRLRHLGLHAAASEPRLGRRVLVRRGRDRTVRHRGAQADLAVWRRPASTHARRGVEPDAQHPHLYRLLAVAARRPRWSAFRRMFSWASAMFRSRRASACFARASRSTNCARQWRAISAKSARRVPSKASRIAAARRSIRAPRPTSTCCAMRSTCSPPPSAPPRRDWRSRCSCAGARFRQRRRFRLLDDASAAIQHSRDLLQHAINYAEQGITVLDRDLRLLAWNQAFVDLYELPPNLVRVGVGMDSIIHFNASRGSYGPGAVSRNWSRAHPLLPARSRTGSARSFIPPARSSRSARTSCPMAASSRPIRM